MSTNRELLLFPVCSMHLAGRVLGAYMLVGVRGPLHEGLGKGGLQEVEVAVAERNEQIISMQRDLAVMEQTVQTITA